MSKLKIKWLFVYPIVIGALIWWGPHNIWGNLIVAGLATIFLLLFDFLRQKEKS